MKKTTILIMFLLMISSFGFLQNGINNNVLNNNNTNFADFQRVTDLEVVNNWEINSFATRNWEYSRDFITAPEFGYNQLVDYQPNTSPVGVSYSSSGISLLSNEERVSTTSGIIPNAPYDGGGFTPNTTG
ncbi:MAG: hypothetical protein OEY49_11485, partial [Candidatus Heimdallarchaeota archaeon]|nr:hypothetical protein [Candidatus Heimdallarchaeota archaeon]